MKVRIHRAKVGAAAVCTALTFLVLVACENNHALHAASTPTGTVGALIAKPKHSLANAAAVLELARSFADHPDTVRMVRPMSGDGYLLEVVTPATQSDLDSMLARMRASGEFEYVDLDLSGGPSKR
jgi:hypothetical protein